ncbi:MAG TPA: HAMP domain-containing sensor histidine kinase [Polyangiaceae bacterium]|nr:HAMP domain-containing sensor histidine kinase [Polyangiaceae bacterium]
MTPAKGPGLRLQIVLSLAGVLLLSYVPLFFAIAGVTSATLLASRERAAHSIGRAVASHVAHATEAGQLADLDAVLTADVGSGGARAIAVFDLDGHRIVEAGELAELARLEAPPRPYRESARPAHGARGRALDVVLPAKAAAVVVRVATDEESVNAAPLVKVVALYMLVFAIALLAFAYFVLTRVLVRPIEELSAAAERVARGARTLDVPRRGAREVVELGRAVDAMASKLLDDEQALRAKVEELTRMTTTLTEARAQLARSEQLASVGRLSAGLAHEIGNPLTAVLAMLDLVADPELPVEERQDFIARMKRETERIHGILRDLLDFARPEANAATSERGASARLEEVLADLEALALPQRPFRDAALVVRVDEDTPRVGMSASRLLQVLLNLVMNAADAVAAAEAPREIRVLARRAGAGVEVRVEDTGPGVPASLAARVFEPFVTTKDVGQGTGLGLAVCRGLVESAGGAITLDPTYEGGARFVVTLPAASE